ncbi:MAG: hypothetical protein LUC93_04030, partial [Planctomycetaceae bacterium]|nr:hypothetical protein [Planctomycetaceae bacterium]
MRLATMAVLLAVGLMASASAGDASARLNPATVQQVVEASFPTYLADHRTVTEIESPTGDLEGCKAMADWLKAQ